MSSSNVRSHLHCCLVSHCGPKRCVCMFTRHYISILPVNNERKENLKYAYETHALYTTVGRCCNVSQMARRTGPRQRREINASRIRAAAAVNQP